MKLERLKLVNFCQHKSFECSFSPGLNGIIGINGAGKSNILEAIKYAITGYTVYPIDNYVTIGHEAEPSSVHLDFSDETGQQHFSITRNIKPSRSALLTTPTGQMRGVNNINTYLQDEFGIDFDLVKNIQIVSQSEWVAMFKLPAAARATLLQRIFACDFLKSKRDTLRQFIMSVTASTSVQDSIKAYTEILNEKKFMLTAYKDLPELEVADTQLAILKTSRAKVEESRNTVKYCDAVKAELAKINKYLSDHADFVDDKTFDLQAASEKKVLAMSNLSELEERTSNLDALLNIADDIKSDYVELEAGTDEIDDLHNKLTHLRARRDRTMTERDLALKAKLLIGPDTTECPLCKHEFGSKEEKEAHYTELTTRIETLNSELTEIFEWERKVNEIDKRLRRVIPHLTDLIRSIPASILEPTSIRDLMPTQAAFTIGAASAIIYPGTSECRYAFLQLLDSIEKERADSDKKHDELLVAYNNACISYTEMYTEYEHYTKLKANIEVARAKKADNEKYLDKFDLIVGVSLDELEYTLNALNEQVDIAYKTVNDINTKMSIERDIKSLEERIAECEKQLTNLVTLADRRQVLENVVSILSPDKFPRAVVLGWLRILESSINTYLEAFNASYKAVVRDNTDIYCDFPDGKSIPSWSLSGGQQVVLAIAWRLALHNTFARSEACGFLTLDEPTTFLDKDNIDNLVSVMGNIKAIADNNNLQILVITHSQSLSPLFDTVIEL